MQGELTQEKKSNIQGDIAVDEKSTMMNVPENINAGDAEPLETRLLDVYKGRAKLAYPHLEPGNATTQFTLEPEQLTLQEGLDVTPGTMAAQVSAYETEKDVHSEGVVYTALGGRVELSVSNFHQEHATAELATMNIISDGAPDAGETEISAYLKEPLVIEPMQGLRLELGQGEYIKHKNDLNPVLKFWQTRLIFDSQSMGEDFQTELDETGLHLTQGQDVQVDEQKPGGKEASEVVDTLKRRMVPEVEEPQEKPVPVAENKESEKSEKSEKLEKEASDDEDSVEVLGEFKEPQSVTKDKFVSLKNIEYEEEQDVEKVSDRLKGKAQFEFEEIPFRIIRPNGKEYSGHTQTKSIGDERMDFEFEDDGSLYVTFDHPIELQMLPDGADWLVCKISLDGARIHASGLVAEKIRIDLGVAQKEDEDDESVVKKLFHGNFYGTVTSVSPESRLDAEGIHVTEEGKRIGKFGVTDFLNFLDVDGDYPTGHLNVTLKKKEKQEAGKSSLFSETAKSIMGEGLSIPIVGPLAFKFAIVPSVEVGGELSAELNRGKSFGEKMKPGESFKLGGNLGVKGTGKLEMSAGLEVGLTAIVTNIASAGVQVQTDLAASIGAEAEAETELGIADVGKGFRQTKDLEAAGSVDIGLSAAAKLQGNVKFLIWKANLFEMELFKKETKLDLYRGTATRDKDVKGVTEGWHFEEMGLTAEKFGRKSFAALRESKKGVTDLKMSEKAVKTLGKEVEEAWVILEQLKEQQTMSKGIYYIEDSERKRLAEQIRKLKLKMKGKLESYEEALRLFELGQNVECGLLYDEVKTARGQQGMYMDKNVIKQQLLKDTARGGLDWKKYRPLTAEDLPDVKPKKIEGRLEEENAERNSMAAIDVAIARALGIRDNAVDRVKEEYELFVQTENPVLAAKHLQGKDLDQPLYKTLDELKEELGEDAFFFKDIPGWGKALKMLQTATRIKSDKNFTNNYFQILWEDVTLNKVKKGAKGYQMKDKRLVDAFRVKRSDGSLGINTMSKYTFLQMLLSGRYPEKSHAEDGTPLGGKEIPKLTAKEKKDFYFAMFDNRLTKEEKEENYIRWSLGDKDYKKNLTQQKQAKDEINHGIYQPLLDSDIDTMVKTGQVPIEQELEGLNQKLEDAKKRYIEKNKEYVQAIETVTRIQKEKAACAEKLKTLGDNATAALELQPDAVAHAVDAVNFVEREGIDITTGQAVYSVAAEPVKENSRLEKVLADRRKELFEKSDSK